MSDQNPAERGAALARVVVLEEAQSDYFITGQGGEASIVVVAGNKALKVYSNGYDKPVELQYAQGEAYAEGWNAARKALEASHD